MTTDEFMVSNGYTQLPKLYGSKYVKNGEYLSLNQATEMHATYLRGQLSEASDVLAGHRASLKDKPEETKHVFQPLVEVLERRIATLTTKLEGLSKGER